MKFVIYLRVSTKRRRDGTGQGVDGLGIQAQEFAARNYVRQVGGEIIEEFREAETGKDNYRPELQKALALCKESGATLVIAKLCRLSRNAAFLLNLRDSGVSFIAADNPNANSLTIGLLAVIAQAEREAISVRTRDALQAAKRRGIRLGNPRWQQALQSAKARRVEQTRQHADELRPVVREIREKAGVTSLRGIAMALTLRGYRTISGKAFRAQTVANLMVL